MQVYPWLETDWRRLTAKPQALHHGLLLSGTSGIGKRAFAEALAQWLLCEQPAAQACGRCRNCHLWRAGSHPDFYTLLSQAQARVPANAQLAAYAERCVDDDEYKKRKRRLRPSKSVLVSQVRILIEQFSTHTHVAARKVALIMADSMNRNAANALLKLLEEPPKGAMLILLSDSPGFLLATIRSRCLLVGLPTPSSAAAQQWLTTYMPPQHAELLDALAKHAPLRALAMYEQGFVDIHETLLGGIANLSAPRGDAIDLAASLGKQEFQSMLLWLQHFVVDLIKWQSGVAVPLWRGRIGLKIERLSLTNLFFLYDRIGQYKKAAQAPLNEQLALENLILLLQRALGVR